MLLLLEDDVKEDFRLLLLFLFLLIELSLRIDDTSLVLS